MTEPFAARQSLVTTFARCPLSARFQLDMAGHRSPELNRGTLAHSCAELMFRELHKTGQPQMPQEQMLEIMRHVLAQDGVPSGEVVTVGSTEREALRQFCVRLASDWQWRPERFLAIEERFYVDIRCPDGEVRRLTGKPDLLVANPSDTTVEIVDLKSGFQAPKTPRSDEPKNEKAYLTERGHAQLDAYGYLVLRGCRVGTDAQAFPRVRGARLREIHPRSAEERTAELWREDLDNIENELGAMLQLLDRAEREGPESDIWTPVPEVKACAWCWGRASCPEATYPERIGTLDSPAAREEAARRLIAQDALRDERYATLKASVDADGPIPLPMAGELAALGWYRSSDPESDGRKFGFCHPSDLHEHQYVSRTGHRRERLLAFMREDGGRSVASGWRVSAAAIYEGESESACGSDLRALVEMGLVSKSDGRPAMFEAVTA